MVNDERLVPFVDLLLRSLCSLHLVKDITFDFEKDRLDSPDIVNALTTKTCVAICNSDYPFNVSLKPPCIHDVRCSARARLINTDTSVDMQAA